MNKVLELMKKTREEGIEVICEDQKIVLKASREKKIDPGLINEFKVLKRDILDYFGDWREDLEGGGEIKAPIRKTEFEGREYYEITPTQSYWVNDELDKIYKQSEVNHGSVALVYKISGQVDQLVFEKSILKVIERHESLRSTYHNIEGKYFMRIESAQQPYFKPSYMDFEDADFIAFNDHTFNLREGPLFLSRLTRIRDDEYILSLKLHHVIFDKVSTDILLRDLIVFYSHSSDDMESRLPALPYQYKEYLSFENAFRNKNYDAHRKYWNRLYPDLHEEIIIPGTEGKARKVVGTAGKESFTYSERLAGKLIDLSKLFSISLFEIIQATVKTYLFCRTSNKNIIIGSYIFGRDYPGAENQIGCYARTVLIRTDFEEQDTVKNAIGKVKRSNEDMRTCRAYTLMEAMKEKSPLGKISNGCFWDVNLQYSDLSKDPALARDAADVSSGGNLSIIILPNPRPVHSTSIDMELHIYRFDKKIDLEVTYSSNVYDASVIKSFFEKYFEYTDEAINDLNIDLGTLRHRYNR